MPIDQARAFIPVRIAVLTVSDSRSLAEDKSGDTLVDRLKSAGHILAERVLLRDDTDDIIALLHRWADDESVDCVITTGGTGVTGRDVTPEALAAHAALLDDIPGLGLLNVTSPDLLHRDWSAARAARWQANKEQGGGGRQSHIEQLLGELGSQAGLVTMIDGAPAALSWLGGVLGHRVSPLGTDRFGQTGDLPDLYRAYRLDSEAVIEAMAELFLQR